MTNQAGGDAGNKWHRQLFVGQIPLHWNRLLLRDHLAKYLEIPDDHAADEIEIDHDTFEKQSINQEKKKIAFIRFQNESYHNRALKKETFFESDIKLNIKESNHENERRKLFFGRLSDDITKDKVTEMIQQVCPGYEQHIEEDFPQVPEKNLGKSRIAFILFKTHQHARDVLEAFQKLIDQKNANGKEKMNVLKKYSHNGNMRDLIQAVDYHRRSGKLSESRKSVTYPHTMKHIDLQMQHVDYQVGEDASGNWVILFTKDQKQVTIRINPRDFSGAPRRTIGFGNYDSLIEYGPQTAPHPIMATSEYPPQLELRPIPYFPIQQHSSNAPSRSLRRHQSSTNNAYRSGRHANLPASRSESGLHRQ